MTIVAIIKKEQRYIQEWLDYHIGLGVNHFLLFDNDEEHIPYDLKVPEGVTVELKPFGEYHGGVAQIKAYDIACKQLTGEIVAFIDIDEFITINKSFANTLPSPTIEEAFKQIGKPAITINWEIYGASGHIKAPKGKTTDVYSIPSGFTSENNSVKSILQISNEDVKWVTPHEPLNIPLYDTNGDISVYTNRKILHDKIYIRHYLTKSWEDWLIRLRRGNLTKGFRRVNSFFTYNPEMLPLFDELVKDLQTSEFKTIYRDKIEPHLKNRLYAQVKKAKRSDSMAQFIIDFFDEHAGLYKTEEVCRKRVAELVNTKYTLKNIEEIIINLM